MMIQTVNPATEEIIKIYPLLSEQDVLQAIEKAQESYKVWSKTTFSERALRLLAVSQSLLKKKHACALLMAQEMGKPVSMGELEIEKCAWVCDYFAEHAALFLEPRMVKTSMQKSMVCHQPLGIVFAIMPWNFPFWQVFRFAAPCIMAGNAILLKHAPISSGTGQMIQHLFIDSGFPEHVFQSVVLDNETAANVIAHESIKAVTLTGSEMAGSSVAATAGKNLKKVVLELGGNDPYVVLHDADLDKAATCIVSSRLNNTGQVCIAAKRVIVVRDAGDRLITLIKKEMAGYKIGDPLDPTTQIGPMARRDLRDTLHQQVLQSMSKGATLCLGGEIPLTQGFYYPPTLLTKVTPGMPAFDDELFGPVISVIFAEDEAHAIALANQSRFGLGAAVFTSDVQRGEAIARYEIDAGVCFVNAQVASDPRLPFGGIKRSGFGRELSREGILEFVNVKTVAISE